MQFSVADLKLNKLKVKQEQLRPQYYLAVSVAKQVPEL